MTFTTKLGQFCAKNPNWEQLLTQEPYNLKINRDGPYIIFKYNQLSSDFTNEIVREARGIIFKEEVWDTPVCHAFDKFGNYGESYASEIDWDSAVVTEKVDGSLFKIWFDNDECHISTNGTINAFKAPLQSDVLYENFGELFLSAFKNLEDFFNLRDSLNTKSTYMFELVSPYNRVVIPHKSTELYFLGRRNEQNEVIPFHKVDESVLRCIQCAGIKLPECYPLKSLNDCIRATQKLPWDEEGYVVDDKHGNRIKIKSPAYVIAHHHRSNGCVNNESLISVILSNEIEEFLTYADEYKPALLCIKETMQGIQHLCEDFLDKKRLMNFENRKAYADWVKSCPLIVQHFLFRNFDRYLTFEEYSADWTASKWNGVIETYELQNKT